MLMCRLAVLTRDAGAALARTLHAALGGAVALLMFASFGTLLSRTLQMNGGAWSTLWPDMRLALAVTHFGHVWLWRLPALALLWLAWTWNLKHTRHARIAGWLMLVAASVIALTRSETGHPADHGDFTLAVWLDWTHLLAAATWVGSLFGMSLAVFPELLKMREPSPRQAAAIFHRLSTLSGLALAMLLACGIYNAIRQLGSVAALWTTPYGMVLDIKLAIVLAMIAIGAHNRYVKLPRLLALAGSPSRPSWFARMLPMRPFAGPTHSTDKVLRNCARAVLFESLLGLAVIGATATLIHAMPPDDRGSMQGMAGVPDNPGVIHSGIR
ncbi:MAG: CopD family protein [Xanthomonadaceae bacterium]|nr:CopD family protein [Xanthomonadaceae bacterium]